jgi:DNA processing protein
MDLRPWALAFTLLPWPERQKAELWRALEAGETPGLRPAAKAELDALWARLPELQAEAAARKARLVLPGDADADRLLAPLPYPVALWVRGSLPPEGPTVAIVGARQASPEAIAKAHAFGRALAQVGVAVISGLARGIDGAAHAGALETGPSWGVLGSGLDHPYPPEHRPLMERMAERGGVLTPFPPQARPQPWHFPRRNVLLAAWADAVLVVEAARRSGSLVTAKLALDMGKELCVVPGSEGPDALLEEGAAHAVRDPAELLDRLASR